MTKQFRLYNLLVQCKLPLTEGQLASRLNTTGDAVRSMVSRVRKLGFRIDTRKRVSSATGRPLATQYVYAADRRSRS